MTEWTERLARVADGFGATAREHGVRLIGIAFPDEQIIVEQADGPIGAVLLDGTSPALLVDLEAPELADPAARTALLALARGAVQRGVTFRRDGLLTKAYGYQRIGLLVSVQLGDNAGIAATVGNIWTLHEAVRDELERGGGPRREPDSDPAGIARRRQELASLVAAIRTDATTAGPGVEQQVELPGAEPRLLHACYRLSRLARDRRHRAALDRLRAVAIVQNAWEVIFLAAADEIAQMTIVDILVAGGLLPPAVAEVDGNDAADAFEAYRTVRGHLPALPAERVLGACQLAARHLGFLRLSSTTAGGVFGQRLSYATSEMLQPVGRDVVYLLRSLGRPNDALQQAESVLARSMVDWATRHHAGRRPAAEFFSQISPLTGSIATAEVAGLPEIRWLAAQGATLLYYLEQPDGYGWWLVRPDGEVLSGRLADPAPVLTRLFAALPYLAGAAIDAARLISGRSPVAARDVGLSTTLAAAHGALFPPEIDQALTGVDRLVVLADPQLESVPFGALRTPRGRYLVEERELSICPSATILALLSASQRVVRLHGTATSEHALVLGRAHFDETYEQNTPAGTVPIRLPSLPGAGTEAREIAAIIGGQVRLDGAATAAALLELGAGADVIHLATHGFFDDSSPEQSFLALADGPFTARDIYEFDRGLHCGMVVLSACQTALGAAHPDSTIGLTNAFLIAGAHAVVSSLWQIPDTLTVALMKRFHRHVRDGLGPAAALRATQREALADPATADPYGWAAFRVSGHS